MSSTMRVGGKLGYIMGMVSYMAPVGTSMDTGNMVREMVMGI
jgi:hypothetical protein